MLNTLPAELIFEIQLLALSEHLPYTNRRFSEIFDLASPTYRARYLTGRFFALSTGSVNARNIVTFALLFPLCKVAVLEALLGLAECPPSKAAPLLPKRLFRPLRPPVKDEEISDEQLPGIQGKISALSEQNEPLPFIKYLFDTDRIPNPDPDSHEGYALARAVHANFIPLVRFLLYHGASPHWKGALPLKIAIRKKNLALVQMLIERDTFDAESRKNGFAKRRKKDDRIVITNQLLGDAIRARAKDIVAYFVLDKHVIADSKNLRLMAVTGVYADGFVSSPTLV